MKRTLSGSHIPVPDHHNQHWTLSFFSIEWSWKHMSTPCTLSKCSPHCLGPNSAFYWQKWTGPNVEGNCTCGTTIAAKTICQKYAVLVSTWNFLQVAGLTSRNFQNLTARSSMPWSTSTMSQFFLQKNSGKEEIKKYNYRINWNEYNLYLTYAFHVFHAP